ncbi:uncharacterized protein K444DRAFT_617089, partial [Hyaloscypha bicolor E]
MAGICTSLAELFCLVIWIFAKSFGVLIFFALMVGTVSGTFRATVAPVGAEVVGLKICPAALSISWTVLVPRCTFAEPIGLQLRTTGGAYLPSRADIHWLDVYWSRFLYVVSKSVNIGELERVAITKERGNKSCKMKILYRGPDQISQGTKV